VLYQALSRKQREQHERTPPATSSPLTFTKDGAVGRRVAVFWGWVVCLVDFGVLTGHYIHVLQPDYDFMTSMAYTHTMTGYAMGRALAYTFARLHIAWRCACAEMPRHELVVRAVAFVTLELGIAVAVGVVVQYLILDQIFGVAPTVLYFPGIGQCMCQSAEDDNVTLLSSFVPSGCASTCHVKCNQLHTFPNIFDDIQDFFDTSSPTPYEDAMNRAFALLTGWDGNPIAGDYCTASANIYNQHMQAAQPFLWNRCYATACVPDAAACGDPAITLGGGCLLTEPWCHSNNGTCATCQSTWCAA